MTDGSQQRRQPVIGITLGDAAGIGPEVIVKALADRQDRRHFRPVVIGDQGVLRRTARSLDLDVGFVPFSNNDSQPSAIEIIDLGNLPDRFNTGEVSSETGKAAGEFIEKAVSLWKSGHIDAICTAPINKKSLELGGYAYPGHTEFIAALTNTREFAMSFFAEKLRVILLSTHIPLAKAIENITIDSMSRIIEFADHRLSGLIRRRVKIAVAGLNPHASENGMFGNEEADSIVPAVERCRANGIEVSGPYSPDTIFLRGFRGEFDAVIACYHDQATIAVKCLSFGKAVNVTLGLPLIRTSVDHGTAFDIAGHGIADESSMRAAIGLAAELALN